jgi:protein-S-isoprenylcysteine O-methyltransferase Ste14
MPDLDSLFRILCVLWILFEVFVSATRRNSPDQQEQDKGSLHLLWFSIMASTMAAASLRYWVPYTRQGAGLALLSPGLGYAGCALIVLGVGLRFWAIRALGRRFTVQVTIVQGHSIVQQGLYCLVRHPAYLGSLVSLLGLGLAFENWASIIAALALPLLATLRRIRIEEALLESHFGAEYAQYKTRTWRLLPWVY